MTGWALFRWAFHHGVNFLLGGITPIWCFPGKPRWSAGVPCTSVSIESKSWSMTSLTVRYEVESSSRSHACELYRVQSKIIVNIEAKCRVLVTLGAFGILVWTTYDWSVGDFFQLKQMNMHVKTNCNNNEDVNMKIKGNRWQKKGD